MKRHLGLFSLLEQGGLEPQKLFCKHRVRRGCSQETRYPTLCCMDDPRTALGRCSMAFPQLSKLYSCSRGSLKCQSLQFSHGPVNESEICFAISGLGGGSGSGGRTALPKLFGQIGEQPEKEPLLRRRSCCILPPPPPPDVDQIWPWSRQGHRVCLLQHTPSQSP